MLHITEEQVRDTLDYPKAIELAREAYVEIAQGEVSNPSRAWLEVPGGASLYSMLAHVKGHKTISVKLARVSPYNQSRSLPVTMATLYLFDAETGSAVAEIEAENLTAIRTAASTAVATDILARKDATSLGVFGSGKQALAHVSAIKCIRDIDYVSVYSLDKESSWRFAKTIAEKHRLTVHVASDPRQVVESSDILVLATTSTTPLFDGNLVKNGTHVNAIGAALPTNRETDSELVRRSFVVVDSRDQAFSSYGDILKPIEEGVIGKGQVKELGQMLTDPKQFSRTADAITLFKSGGIAALDAVVADYLVSHLGT